MQNKPTLYLIRGVCGAGKSTFARSLLAQGLVSRCVEADQFFMEDGEYRFDVTKLSAAHSWCQIATRHTLFQQQSVVVANTSTTEREVKTYQDIAEEYDANFVSIIVENRHNGVNIHNVPKDKIRQMKERFSVKL